MKICGDCEYYGKIKYHKRKGKCILEVNRNQRIADERRRGIPTKGKRRNVVVGKYHKSCKSFELKKAGEK